MHIVFGLDPVCVSMKVGVDRSVRHGFDLYICSENVLAGVTMQRNYECVCCVVSSFSDNYQDRTLQT